MTAPGSFLSSISFLNALVRRARRAADMPPASGEAAARAAPLVAVGVLCCAPAASGQTSAAIAAISESVERGPGLGLQIMTCLPRRGLGLEHSHGLAGEPGLHVLQRLAVEDTVDLLGDVAEVGGGGDCGEVAAQMSERRWRVVL